MTRLASNLAVALLLCCSPGASEETPPPVGNGAAAPARRGVQANAPTLRQADARHGPGACTATPSGRAATRVGGRRNHAVPNPRTTPLLGRRPVSRVRRFARAPWPLIVALKRASARIAQRHVTAMLASVDGGHRGSVSAEDAEDRHGLLVRSQQRRNKGDGGRSSNWADADALAQHPFVDRRGVRRRSGFKSPGEPRN